MAAEPPPRNPSVVLAGIDQGRAEHWLWAEALYVLDDPQLSPNEQYERAAREVLWAGAIQSAALPERLEALGVDFALIDADPERRDAADLADRVWCIELAQRKSQKDDYKEGEVSHGGDPQPCWFLRQERFLRQVLLGFTGVSEDGYPPYRLPAEWEQWYNQPESERNPLKHLKGPSFNPEEGKWQRPKDRVDDLYFAASFSEAAAAIWLDGLAEELAVAEAYGARKR